MDGGAGGGRQAGWGKAGRERRREGKKEGEGKASRQGGRHTNSLIAEQTINKYRRNSAIRKSAFDDHYAD